MFFVVPIKSLVKVVYDVVKHLLSLFKTAGHGSQKFQVPAHVGALQRPRLRGDLPGADWKSRGKQRRCRGVVGTVRF